VQVPRGLCHLRVDGGPSLLRCGPDWCETQRRFRPVFELADEAGHRRARLIDPKVVCHCQDGIVTRYAVPSDLRGVSDQFGHEVVRVRPPRQRLFDLLAGRILGTGRQDRKCRGHRPGRDDHVLPVGGRGGPEQRDGKARVKIGYTISNP
jgi:hypothetical protein